MKFDNFEILATPEIYKASCRQCHNYMTEVFNGWFGRALYCPKCQLVYTVKLIQVPRKKVSKEFIEQCKKTVSRKSS